MTTHLRATRHTTYCGEPRKSVKSTRFSMFCTCGRCYSLQRFYAALDVRLLDYQLNIVAHLWKQNRESRGNS